MHNTNRLVGRRPGKRGPHIDLPCVLSRIPLLSRLDPAVQRELAEAGRLREFLPETVVVSEGDAGDSLYIVVAGMLEASCKDGNDATRVIGRLHPGEVFGEMSCSPGRRAAPLS